MLLIHKETGEIVEVLVKEIGEELYIERDFGLNVKTFRINQYAFRSRDHIPEIYNLTYDEIPFHFEILGFL